MKESANYLKLVEWSEEDQVFVGQCPGIIGPCCHGDSEIEVYKELCMIVDEWLEVAKDGNEELPSPTTGRKIAEQILSFA
jgi:predicted RNase H-like HicB family nuclease